MLQPLVRSNNLARNWIRYLVVTQVATPEGIPNREADFGLFTPPDPLDLEELTNHNHQLLIYNLEHGILYVAHWALKARRQLPV